MEREINEEKRQKFIEYAGKRVNNVLHDIQILEPMARSNTYDFTRKDVEDMFKAMQETLNEAKQEFDRKFDERARSEKKTFSFTATGDVTGETMTYGVSSYENTTYGNNTSNTVSVENISVGTATGGVTTETIISETPIVENITEGIDSTIYDTNIEPTTTEI